MARVLARNWWAFAFRGLIAVLFGLVALGLPGVTLMTLIALFGTYALVDGIGAVVAGVRAAERHERWWPMVLEGVAGIGAGVLTFAWPVVTAILWLYLLSGWASISGALKIASAVRLRRGMRGAWVLAANGALAILFALSALLLPGLAILSLVWVVGAYALIRGIAFLALAFRLRAHHSHR